MPRYKVLAPCVIRTGAAMDFPKADPDNACLQNYQVRWGRRRDGGVGEEGMKVKPIISER